VKWFGESWCAPICDEEHVAVPTGTECYLCTVPFVAADRGITMPFHAAPGDPPELSAHLHCFARSICLCDPRAPSGGT